MALTGFFLGFSIDRKSCGFFLVKGKESGYNERTIKRTAKVKGGRMPRSQKQKLKLLYLMRAFMEKTDEKHSLTMAELIGELERYDIRAERKSIYDDIECLKLFGFDILYRKEQPAGYYLASREFELPELKLLVDIVQSSKFLTIRKSEELIHKLENLLSHYEAVQLQRQVYVKDRIKMMNESIYYNVDRIHEAISENKQLVFQYFEWTPSKKVRKKKQGALYKVSPWALLWAEENYYLVGYDSSVSMVRHYRVDRMLSISIAGDCREGKEHFENFDVADFTRKTFGMFGGEECRVGLLFENQLAGVVIDRFGKEIFMHPVDEGHFMIHMQICISAPFFGWLATLGRGVEITEPETVRSAYLTYLQEITELYGKREVQENDR